jgi:D-3-phosphoglycerate dehydrogenase
MVYYSTTMSSDRPRALILAPYDECQLERLSTHCDVTYESWTDSRRLYDPNELASRMNNDGVTILVVESDFVFEEAFEQTSSLKFVGICRTATNHIDLGPATRHGVVVVNTPGRNAQAVAEHTLALIFALARRIPEAHQHVYEGHWKSPIEPYVSMRGIELHGRTLGIVGYGNIGRRLSSMATAVGMRVLAYDPYFYFADVIGDVELVDLDTLIRRGDFVSLHVPQTPKTQGMVTERHIASMKPTSFFLNLSDPSVVDQAALVSALREHRIAGAALDVYETHPIAPDSPYLGLGNVILTPHIGGATQETIERHSEMMTDDILRFLDSHRPLNLVNPEVWDRVG